jgi:hypothetical protein
MPNQDPKNPEHYSGKIQPIDFIMANGIGYCEGNVIKYVARWKRKNRIDDLLKAQRYLEFLINNETNGAPRNAG